MTRFEECLIDTLDENGNTNTEAARDDSEGREARLAPASLEQTDFGSVQSTLRSEFCLRQPRLEA
jgi:hypothetical protein